MATSKTTVTRQVQEETRAYSCDGCAIRVREDKPAALIGWMAVRPLSAIVGNDPRDLTSHFCPTCSARFK